MKRRSILDIVSQLAVEGRKYTWSPDQYIPLLVIEEDSEQIWELIGSGPHPTSDRFREGQI